MDTKKLKILLTLADLGSFTKTAKKYDYTPSAITHMMKSLESELGFPLLIRGKHSIKLTKNGKRLIPIIQKLNHLEEDFDKTISEINGLYTGTITIGCYSSIAINWLPKIILKFHNDFPNININLMEGVHNDIISWLDERKVDLAFMSCPDCKQNDFISLQKVPMIAVLPTTHSLNNASSYPIGNCSSENFIMPAQGNDFDVVDLFDKENISLKIKYKTHDNFATLSMIEKGIGMSVMNELVTQGLAWDVIKLPLEKKINITLGISCPDYTKLSPACLKFINYSKELLTDKNYS